MPTLRVAVQTPSIRPSREFLHAAPFTCCWPSTAASALRKRSMRRDSGHCLLFDLLTSNTQCRRVRGDFPSSRSETRDVAGASAAFLTAYLLLSSRCAACADIVSGGLGSRERHDKGASHFRICFTMFMGCRSMRVCSVVLGPRPLQGGHVGRH